MSTLIRKSFHSLPPTYVPQLRRQAWSRLFGLFIRGRRNELNMSVEEAAGLSGMTVSEWAAMEAGHVPQQMDRLRAISAAIELTWDGMVNMLALCQEAWTL